MDWINKIGKIKVILGGAIILALIVGVKIGWQRLMFESINTTVEVTLSNREVNRLAQLGGFDKQTVLKRLKDEGHITSISVEEDTLQDFVDSGRVTLLKGSDVVNMNRIGNISRFILNQLYGTDSQPKAGFFYVIVEQAQEYERIRDFMRTEFGYEKVREIDRWNILEVIDEQEDLLEVGLGISPGEVEMIQAVGLHVIARPKNSNRLSENMVRIKFQNLASLSGVSTVIFEGDSVLGYPTEIRLAREKMEAGNFNLGVLEFTPQFGVRELSADRQTKIVRVHSIPEADTIRLTRTEATHRYIRAAKERGIKILFVHPLFKDYRETNIVDYNLAYFNDLYQHLRANGFMVGPISEIPIQQYSPAQNWELFFLSLGAIAVCFVLLNFYFPIRLRQIIGVTVAAIVLFYAAEIFGLSSVWNRLMALMVAIAAPALAIISQFPKPEALENRNWKSKMGFVLVCLVKALAISLGGALLIVGFLSDTDYLFAVRQFFGVKMSFIIPVILVGMYFFLRPHRMTSTVYVLKRLFYSPVRTSSLVAVVLCLLVVLVYILRSGNYLVVHIPLAEGRMRALLELWLSVRPRTKEFLIGYPLLLCAFYYGHSERLRHWQWFYTSLGTVALVSVVNSFCHMHTPLLVSLYRTLLGFGIGIAMGLLYIGILKGVRVFLGRFQ